MPSAQTVVVKPEKSTIQESTEPYKNILGVIEKKVRNLEKRKEKLDGYKKLLSSGQALNEDQKNAVALYSDVLSSLVLAQELAKQFAGLAADYEKIEKKRKRKEAQERLLQDAAKIKEVLVVQDILNNMSPEVHDDFVNGTNGACVLTEDQLRQLDEFFPLINPREEQDETENFQTRLASSAEHLASIIEGKQKDVVGTNYKELREVIFKIADSKYFDEKPEVQSKVAEAEAEPEAEPEVAEPEEVVPDNGYPEEIEEPIPAEVVPAIPKIETTHFYRSNVPVPEVVPVEEILKLDAARHLEDQEPVQAADETTPVAPLSDAPVAIDNWDEGTERPKEESNVWQTRDKPRERGAYRGGRGDYRGDYRGGFRGRGERREGGFQNGRGGGRGRDDRYNDRGREGGYGDRDRNYVRPERNYDDREQGSGDRERYSYDRSNGERGRGGFRGPRGANRGAEPRGRGGYGRGSGYSDRGGDRGGERGGNRS